ncbi:hypothetical protein PMZ80_004843 [Knufia obscura]|uniref:Uncharacterized protein n=1 Tax=Knufia obscura TaxID=1635080 RepID=A0ABR0RNX6_9EURO|nr:hypothetical protein PMZ80_004843 [Knufia obscura]
MFPLPTAVKRSHILITLVVVSLIILFTLRPVSRPFYVPTRGAALDSTSLLILSAQEHVGLSVAGDTKSFDLPDSASPLHLIVPATSSNHHLCQLLLSAAILGYPSPTLINWNAPEDEDDYVQHLTKVEGILNHLNSLEPQHDDDLVLMVDGYDAWFQLPPSVLIERYHSLVRDSSGQYSRTGTRHLLVRRSSLDTVFFGQDKLCWPGGRSRAACWAVPDSTLSLQAFGPDTDHGIVEHNRPRWLNSGTIMGPVKDVRDVFIATLEKIRANHTENSDQFYFANVFAEQSYARQPAEVPTLSEEETVEIPDIPDGQRTEYHIGIDYESALFQTVAFYEDYIAWVMYNQSSDSMKSDHKHFNPYHHFALPEDLQDSSPLDTLPEKGKRLATSHSSMLAEALGSWSSLPLGVNTITKQVFPLIHFTGKKGYREMWWHRNWFYPYAGDLLRHKQSLEEGVGDAWTAGQEVKVIPWSSLCGRYEEYLFGQAD